MQNFLIGFSSGILFTLTFMSVAKILYKPPPMPR